MKKIIHIATDEKFINSAYWQFEQVFPAQNLFYILVQNTKDNLKYINIEDRMILYQNSILMLKKLANSIDKDALVVFHGLTYYSSIIANRLVYKNKFIWLLFGVEFYDNPYFFERRLLFGEQTYLTFVESNLFKNRLKVLFRDLYYRFKSRTRSPWIEVRNAIEKTNTVGILYKEEYDLIKSKVSFRIPLNFFKFSYYPIEKMIDNVNSFTSSDGILVGNSASYTNNHLEVFNILEKLKIGDRKIICPLSYGDKNYANSIKREGAKRFGGNFEPLLDFRSLQDYNNIIKKCNIVIMNQYRQQAVGNIVVMLWMGAKVFLDERNSLYHYFKRIGVKIFSISKDLLDESSLNLLRIEDVLHNRKILEVELSQAILLEELKTYIESISQ